MRLLFRYVEAVQIRAVVLEQGEHEKLGKNLNAKAVFTGRVYTGVNMGKTYPNAGRWSGWDAQNAKRNGGDNS